METIPQHEKKSSILDTDLYRILNDRQRFKAFCNAITEWDKAVLTNRFTDELWDARNGTKASHALVNTYFNTTQLEARLHHLNEHMEANTHVNRKVNGFQD